MTSDGKDLLREADPLEPAHRIFYKAQHYLHRGERRDDACWHCVDWMSATGERQERALLAEFWRKMHTGATID